MIRIAHVDMDEIIYYTAFKYGKNCETADDIIDNFRYEVYARTKKLSIDVIKYYVGCSRANCFRRRILPSYKAHRDLGHHDPKFIPALKDYSFMFFGAITHKHLEADDLIGLAVTNNDGNLHVAVTQDKDILTVPCYYYNPTKDIYGCTSRDEALYNLMVQVLTGDTADGYKGVHGIGKAKANKILGGTTKFGWQKVYRAYLNAGLTREDLRKQYLMARILTRNYHE